jgi:alkylation response protein AidB-like acyl-CoA dehydrogenase
LLLRSLRPDPTQDPSKTLAKRDGRDFILKGEKRFITNGGVADYLFLSRLLIPAASSVRA